MPATEKYVPSIPPKTPTPGVDFIGILDAFDPSTLDSDARIEFARRNPWETAYWSMIDGTPAEPVEHRLHLAKFVYGQEKEALIHKVNTYQNAFQQGLPIDRSYKNARTALIRVIGTKAALYIVQQEYDSMTDHERTTQIARYEEWVELRKTEIEIEQQEHVFDYEPEPDTADKIKLIQKGVRRNAGSSFTQRDFAKLLDYPIHRLAEVMIGREYPDAILLEKLILICHANPYWLLDDICPCCFAELDIETNDLRDIMPVFADYGVILKWIKSGKPMCVDYAEYWE